VLFETVAGESKSSTTEIAETTERKRGEERVSE
jgi:hypothetical protein